MRRIAWLIVGGLAGLFAIATVVLLASHFSPIVIHTGQGGDAEGFRASWAAVGALAGASALLLVAAVLLAPREP